jgi:hypothetical protein
MDGLYEQAAAPLTVDIDGTKWQFAPMDINMWAQVELEVLKKRRRPQDVIAEWLPSLAGEDRKTLLEMAWREELRGPMVPRWDVSLWESTITGVIHKAWLRLKRYHPDVTIEQADQLLRAMSLQEKALLDATEGGQRGNSDSPAAPTGASTTTGASPGVQSQGASTSILESTPNSSAA